MEKLVPLNFLSFSMSVGSLSKLDALLLDRTARETPSLFLLFSHHFSNRIMYARLMYRECITSRFNKCMHGIGDALRNRINNLSSSEHKSVRDKDRMNW